MFLVSSLNIVPSNQSSGVTLHPAAVRPPISSRAPLNINSMLVTMSTSRHQLLAPSTFTTMENKHCKTRKTEFCFNLIVFSGLTHWGCFLLLLFWLVLGVSHTTENSSTTTTTSYAVSGTISYASNSGQPVTNPTSSSSRPSILRKRTVDGSVNL